MNVAIIAAAGQGRRMGSDRPKQFLELAGIPIIIHTVRAFDECAAIQEILVVLPAEDAADFLALAGKYSLRKVTQVLPGGVSRADSVCRGLRAIRPATAEIVAVHDGVRPFVTADEISRTVAAAAEHGAAILVAGVTDTVKEVKAGSVVRTLRRDGLRRALTPQCFRYALLRRAYEEVDLLDPELTDESVLFERLGLEVATVDGSSRNIKITVAEDIAVGEALLRDRSFQV
jgi:2-C-methyl-D-erythritol 4-phosphate cytidylyltransferase